MSYKDFDYYQREYDNMEEEEQQEECIDCGYIRCQCGLVDNL